MTPTPAYLDEGGRWPASVTGLPRRKATLIAVSGQAKRHLGRPLSQVATDGALAVPWGLAGYVMLQDQPIFITTKCFQSEDPSQVWARTAPAFLRLCRNLPGSAVWISGAGGFQVTRVLLAWWADYYSVVLWRALRQYPIMRYEDHRARLTYVRGQILWSKQLVETSSGGSGVWCSFRAYQADNDLNRLLHWAARRFLHIASSLSGRDRLTRCIEAFAGSSRLEPDRRVVAGLRLPPAMVVYRDPFSVARTLFEGRYPALGPGEVPAFGFVINMVKAFEAFVDGLIYRVVALANRRGERWVFQSQQQHPLAYEVATDTARYYTRPDNAVSKVALAERVGVVVDAKYKGLAEDAERYPKPTSSDLYQVLAACVARGWGAAVVISPAIVTSGVTGAWRIKARARRGDDIRIVHWQVDLTACGDAGHPQEGELLELVASLLSDRSA